VCAVEAAARCGGWFSGCVVGGGGAARLRRPGQMTGAGAALVAPQLVG